LQVTDKLQTLNDEFAAMTKKKKELEDAIEVCCQKLDRAGKLIGELTKNHCSLQIHYN
jgi:dynein heavy chain